MLWAGKCGLVIPVTTDCDKYHKSGTCFQPDLIGGEPMVFNPLGSEQEKLSGGISR